MTRSIGRSFPLRVFRAISIACLLIVSESAGAPGQDATGLSKQVEDVLNGFGFKPKIEATPLGNRFKYVSGPKIGPGGTVTSVTVFAAKDAGQAAMLGQAVCSMYVAPTYGPAESVSVGLADPALVFKSLGAWLTEPPYWIPYGQSGGHLLCGRLYIGVTQEKAASAPLKTQAETKEAGARLAAAAQLNVVDLLKKLAEAFKDKGIGR